MKYDVLNLTYNDFITLSEKENIEQLREVTKELVTIARNRAKTLKKHELAKYSPALKNYDNKLSSRTIFKDIKNANPNKLKHLYASAKRFTNAKTSTVTGFNKVKKELYERLGFNPEEHKDTRGRKRSKSDDYYTRKKISQEKRFWKLYDKLLDNFGGTINDLGSERIQSILYETMFDKTQYQKNDDILNKMNEEIERLYSQEVQTYYNGEEEFHVL